jgi:hypothetical protein
MGAAGGSRGRRLCAVGCWSLPRMRGVLALLRMRGVLVSWLAVVERELDV